MFEPKAMPATPMTKEEMARQCQLVSEAAPALDCFTEDELERVKRYSFENDAAGYFAALESGEPVPIDEETFYYFLEVLPPVGFNGEQNGESMRMVGMGGQWGRKDGSIWRFSFAFAEGTDYITVFWKKDGSFCCQKTGIVNR